MVHAIKGQGLPPLLHSVVALIAVSTAVVAGQGALPPDPEPFTVEEADEAAGLEVRGPARWARCCGTCIMLCVL